METKVKFLWNGVEKELEAPHYEELEAAIRNVVRLYKEAGLTCPFSIEKIEVPDGE